MLTPVRVLAVGLVAILSTGLLALSLSSAPSPSTGWGAPGASSSPVAAIASPDGLAAEPAGQPIAWDTGCVQMTADWLHIFPDTTADDASQIFTADGEVALNSDPGNDTYRTLEATWFEGASEMRLNLYLDADEDSWWVRELRTYDGQPVPDWITFPGPLFDTPLDETYTGDVLLDSHIGNVPGTVEIRGLTLAVPGFGPGSEPATCLNTSPTSNVDFVTVTEASPVPGRDREGKVRDASLSPTVIEALDVVAADLLANCCGREEGVARLTAALVEAGESGFFVRTDGPIGGPDEQMDEIVAHVDAGCVIYGGSGSTADGARVFYIGGGSGARTSTFVPAGID